MWYSNNANLAIKFNIAVIAHSFLYCKSINYVFLIKNACFLSAFSIFFLPLSNIIAIFAKTRRQDA